MPSFSTAKDFLLKQAGCKLQSIISENSNCSVLGACPPRPNWGLIFCYYI